MSVKGKWHVVEIPDYDMALSRAYILFGKSEIGRASCRERV